MLLHRFSQVLSLLAVSALCPTAHAALVITEVMSSSGHPGGPANGDWFELHNSGASTLDLTGYYWDDDGMFGNDGALFPSLSLSAGETVVIVIGSPGIATAVPGTGFVGCLGRDRDGIWGPTTTSSPDDVGLACSAVFQEFSNLR